MSDQKYKVGDQVQVNVGSDKDPIWLKMKVCETHPIIPHIQVKMPVHPSTSSHEESAPEFIRGEYVNVKKGWSDVGAQE